MNADELWTKLPLLVREELTCECEKGAVLGDDFRKEWANPSKGRMIISVCTRCSKAQKYSVQIMAQICEICSHFYLMTFDSEGVRNDRGRCPDCTTRAEVHPAFAGRKRTKVSFN